jgi:hypothetical protein
LNVEPRNGVVAVGRQTSLLAPQPDVESVVHAYVDLLVTQRAETPVTRDDLRDVDLGALADALHRPLAEVEMLVARDLDRRAARAAAQAAPPRRRFFKGRGG